MRFPWLKNSKNKTKVGIFITNQRIDICALSADRSQLALLDSEHLILPTLAVTLSTLISKHKLQDSHCHVVLSSELYQQQQIDKPKVADEEIASSLPFIAKGYISEAIETVVFDYFLVPNQAKINLVYCKKSLVTDIVAAMKLAKVTLDCIGIEELATTNLFSLHAVSPQSAAEHSRLNSAQMLISQQDFQEVSLTIIYDNQLYFSRRLRGFSRLRELPAEQLDSSSLLDSFSLEIQRSADFVVSQLKIPEVKNINVALPSASLDALIARLQDNFTIPLSRLQNSYLSDDIDVGFFPVIGAALEGL